MVTKRPLVTSDRKILDWASTRAALQCLDACVSGHHVADETNRRNDCSVINQ